MHHVRSYREILAIAGAKPGIVIRQADGCTAKIWCELGYSISLVLDEKDVCIGVMDEDFLWNGDGVQ